jgi:hypothetical protein
MFGTQASHSLMLIKQKRIQVIWNFFIVLNTTRHPDVFDEGLPLTKTGYFYDSFL